MDSDKGDTLKEDKHALLQSLSTCLYIGLVVLFKYSPVNKV